MHKIVLKTAASTMLLALALLAASLLPAIQFIGISYADDDDKDRDRGRDRHDDEHDDDDNDSDDDSSSGLVIGASKDTYLRKIASNTNEGANDILRLTHIGSNRALVAFDLSEIEGDEVESATLKLYIVENENDWKEVGKVAKTIRHQTISVHPLTQYWEEGNGSNEIFDRNRGNGPGATWQCAVDAEIRNNKPDCRDKWHGGTFEGTTDKVSIKNRLTGIWIEFDVTEDVNKFLSGEETNYGWLVKKDSENLHGAVRFASSETDNGPRLAISGGGDPNGPPSANEDSVSTSEDTQVAFNVLSNDSDPDGDVLTAAIATNPSHGSVSLASDGSATYTPSGNYYGPDSFTYSAGDGSATDTASVAITISPVNDAPVASDSGATASEGGMATITLPATDADGDSLTYTIVSPPQHGTIGDDDGDDSVTFTPTAGFAGDDSFTFKADDGSAESNVATISITVTDLPNQNPVAGDDSASTDEGDPVTINVLGNDSDGDGGTLAVVSATDPPHGTAAVNGDGTITYTPDGSYSGTDSFAYAVEDGQGGSDSATVTVTINLVNGPPEATDDSASTDEDSPVTIDILGNDSDPDGDTVSVSSVSTPAYGTAAIVPGGVLYTPTIQTLAAGQVVTDTFTYTVSDGTVDDTATITVTVNGLNDAPAASDGSLITNEGDAVAYTLPATDPDVGDTLTFAITDEPESGGIVLSPDGSLLYTPDIDYAGTDSFAYSATDGSSASDTGMVTVTVNPVNDPPVAVDDAAPITPPGIPVTIDVLANDFDIEGDTLDVILISTPSFGIAILNSDNTITFTPNLDLVGQDWIDYTVSDGNGGTDDGRVMVTVAGGALVAINDFVTTEEDEEVDIDILANDIGVNANTQIAFAAQPLHGDITNNNGIIEYEPDEGFVGVDFFVYTIFDDANFGTATVTITVLPSS